MDRCDVLIVGAGPAGSSCAWALRDSGLDVVILDQSGFPRDKLCGGWIPAHVLDTLEIDVRDYAGGRTLQPISGFSVSILGSAATEVLYPHTVGYGIRRCEFDHYLLARTGARVILNTRVHAIERAVEGWIVNGQFRSHVLVGAGGHFCPVAKWLGTERTGELVVAQGAEIGMDSAAMNACPVPAEVPELFFCRDLKGYGWCFRKDGVLNIGLGRLDRRHFTAHVSAFLQFLERTRGIRVEPERLRGHAYFVREHPPGKIAAPGLLLAGDSAGLACPSSGEGIRPAIVSGLVAATAIRSANPAGSYPSLLERALGRQSSGGFPGLPAWLAEPSARILMHSRAFVRSMVLDRCFLPPPDRLPEYGGKEIRTVLPGLP